MDNQLFRVMRRIDGREFALGKSEGGKRGWGDGQYYWFNPKNSRVCNFKLENAKGWVDHFKERQTRLTENRLPQYRGEFFMEPIADVI